MKESDFHPDHLADLRKSGINDNTIELKGLHSVRPNRVDNQHNINMSFQKGHNP